MIQYKRLGDLAEITTGFPFKSELFNTSGNGYRLIRGMNVTRRALRWGENTRWWSNVTENLSLYSMVVGDIVLGMDGSLVGKNYARLRQSDLPSFLVQRVARIRATNPCLQNYLWHCIASKPFESYVESIKTGSAIPHISKAQIGDYPIAVLENEIDMIRVGDLLQRFDDKIEINNRINGNL